MKIVAIIQARMGSTRLPGKVLKDIGGETMLARVVQRTRRANMLDQIVVATTSEPEDDVIVAECEHLGVPVFRGNELDVLDRYYQSARMYEAEIVVRITADCPFIDPKLIDQAISSFVAILPDYASNGLDRTYPRGTMPEVMKIGALAQSWREAVEPYQRVHVTPYIYQNPDKFHLLPLKGNAAYGNYRWTVDAPEDLKFARAIFTNLDNNESFSWLDILELLKQQPELKNINWHITQKRLEEG